MSFDTLVALLTDATKQGKNLSATELAAALPQVSRPTVNRWLVQAIAEGKVKKLGKGPATRYVSILGETHVLGAEPLTWSERSKQVLSHLALPISNRKRVGFESSFHADYVPNQDSLLGHDLARSLAQRSRQTDGREPAGTYLQQLLEPLLIDMSWSSSKLEGNHYSLADTRELFERVRAGNKEGIDRDAIMLLNHKEAIQFLAQAVPSYGLDYPVVMETHRLLMQGLLFNSDSLGAIRRSVVTIHGTTYTPNHSPHFLEAQLKDILEKAQQIDNPAESAFFLWVNTAYLQPFEDGNKRMSRLLANFPLLISNNAPLSFLDVDRQDYAQAMVAVYELNDVSVARDLFAWAYQRSIEHYATILKAMPAPDVTSVLWREPIKRIIQQVVINSLNVPDAVLQVLGSSPEREDRTLIDTLIELVNQDLDRLAPFNAARYWLTPEQVENWKASQNSLVRITGPKS